MRGSALSKIDTTLPYWLPPQPLAATLLLGSLTRRKPLTTLHMTHLDILEARKAAEELLDKILKTQPTLFQNGPDANEKSGEAMAQFCERFIEAYSAYLFVRAQ
ncbi:hypothetical protein [Ralstonia edaphi]|uniref:hypothetical protein n=2 Tax=Ralstonia TaxID=48736 RepID=UPI00292FB92A|nr:hypothetical protein [Ralstonia sp. LMG 6871]